MKPFLIIKAGGTFREYAAKKQDFENWTVDGMGLTPAGFVCVDVQKGQSPGDPDQYAGCVITGAHEMVTDGDEWIRQTGQWIADATRAGLPMLGICFGHQLMAHYLGGEAGNHPDGMEIGTAVISLNEAAQGDPLFSLLPVDFPAHVIHSQTTLSLPAQAVVLAASKHDCHQAVRFAENAWGVQFHPEFDEQDISYYIQELSPDLEKAGRDVAALGESVKPTPEAAGLLSLFVELCRS